jgi:hypothetical protein
VGDLADRGRALVYGFANFAVGEVEHLAEHEHRPFDRRERLQHEQHRQLVSVVAMINAANRLAVIVHQRGGSCEPGTLADIAS